MRDLRNSTALFIVSGFFLWNGFNLIGLIFSAMALAKLVNWYRHPHRKLLEHIKNDAKKFHVSLPQRLSIRQNLLKLYSRVELLQTYHPYTKDSLSELINSMWRTLKYNPDMISWSKEINDTVLLLPEFSQVEYAKSKSEFQIKALKDKRIWDRASEKAKGY